MFAALSWVCAAGALIVARGQVSPAFVLWWLVLMVPATIAADTIHWIFNRRAP